MIAFVIFFWIMKAFAWGPQDVLNKRQQAIEDGFVKIEHGQAEADKLRSSTKAVRDIEQEGAGEDPGSRRRRPPRGRRTGRQRPPRSRNHPSQVRESVRHEIAKARVELRDEIVTLTIQASEKLLRERLDDEGDRRLAAAFVDELQGQGVNEPASILRGRPFLCQALFNASRDKGVLDAVAEQAVSWRRSMRPTPVAGLHGGAAVRHRGQDGDARQALCPGAQPDPVQTVAIAARRERYGELDAILQLFDELMEARWDLPGPRRHRRPLAVGDRTGLEKQLEAYTGCKLKIAWESIPG
jgi:F0F1-type ATP synthase membrane subunit b/b'